MSFVIVLLFRLFALMPLSWLHALGAILGRLICWLSPAYRRHLHENLTRAGFHDRGLERRAAAEAGKSVLELPFVWMRPEGDVLLKTQSKNWELIDEARARGRGIIFLTPHLGCFEVTAQYFATNRIDGAPITVLYRPPRKVWLQPLIELARARANLRLAPADLGGVRRLIRALRRGEAVGLLPDQVPSIGEGIWAPFFGTPAFTMTLPGKLHEMTEATILLAWGERLARGKGWVIHLQAFDRPMSADPLDQATEINAAMERLVVRCPEQYFWGYNRYKTPRGVSPPGPAA